VSVRWQRDSVKWRERQRRRESVYMCVCESKGEIVCVCVCVCVCERERMGGRDSASDWRERGKGRDVCVCLRLSKRTLMPTFTKYVFSLSFYIPC
jgi:hypothetical protein